MNTVRAFRKNSTEKVRVSVERYRDHVLLSARVWYRTASGEMRPGKQGLAVRIEQAEDLLRAIIEVVREHDLTVGEAPTHSASGRA